MIAPGKEGVLQEKEGCFREEGLGNLGKGCMLL